MDGFISSLMPFFRKYFIESVFILIGLILAIISITIYIHTNTDVQQNEDLNIKKTHSASEKPKTITVEVSGSVKKAGVIEVASGTRLKAVIDLAQGLSEEADRAFFARNFNLSQVLVDQEKIYIPNVQEISNGVFSERKQLLDYTNAQPETVSQTDQAVQEKININTATVDELDTLPGVGAASAQKIIQNRPYVSINELQSKKVLNKNVFGQVKDLLSL